MCSINFLLTYLLSKVERNHQAAADYDGLVVVRVKVSFLVGMVAP